jgi:hypothetical protein
LTKVFLTLSEVFPCIFLSCKANARVKLAKTGHSPRSYTLFVICVARLLFVLFCVLFVCKCVLPLGDNSNAVNKYIMSVCQFMGVYLVLTPQQMDRFITILHGRLSLNTLKQFEFSGIMIIMKFSFTSSHKDFIYTLHYQ